MKNYPLRPGLLVLSRRQQEALQNGNAVEISVRTIHRTLIGWAMPPGRARSDQADEHRAPRAHGEDRPIF